MKMHKVVLCILALIIPISSSSAIDVGFDGSVGAFSSYIWRGFRLSDEALQIQPSATVSFKGFSANVWAEYDSDTEEWLEVDYTAAYAHDFNKLSLELGYIHYDIRDGLDSDEIYLAAGYDVVLNPALTIYADINEGKGAFVTAGISHPVELNAWAGLEFGASISMIADNGYIATDENGDEFTGLFNSDLTASGSISIGEHFSVEPMVGYTLALSDNASNAIENSNSDGDDAFIYGGITLSASF